MGHSTQKIYEDVARIFECGDLEKLQQFHEDTVIWVTRKDKVVVLEWRDYLRGIRELRETSLAAGMAAVTCRLLSLTEEAPGILLARVAWSQTDADGRQVADFNTVDVLRRGADGKCRVVMHFGDGALPGAARGNWLGLLN